MVEILVNSYTDKRVNVFSHDNLRFSQPLLRFFVSSINCPRFGLNASAPLRNSTARSLPFPFSLTGVESARRTTDSEQIHLTMPKTTTELDRGKISPSRWFGCKRYDRVDSQRSGYLWRQMRLRRSRTFRSENWPNQILYFGRDDDLGRNMGATFDDFIHDRDE